MNQARRVGVLLATVALMATAGLQGAAAQDAEGLTPVNFALGNSRSPQYFAYYVAQDAGFFEEEGLDVNLEIISGGGAVVQQLIAGGIDITNVGAAPVIQAVANGQCLKWVFTWFHRNIFTLAAPADGPVMGLEDLRGKVVGISEPSGGEVPFLRAVFSSVGMTEGVDYDFLAVGEGGQLTMEALRNDQAQAYSSSVYDVASIEGVGMPLRLILPDEFVYVPSIGHVVTCETFESDPDMVTRFGRAIAKAIVFAQANPEAALAIAEKAQPELFEDMALVDAIWATTQLMVTPPEDIGDQIGAPYLPGWESYLAAASEGTEEEGALARPVTVDEIVDSSTLDAVNDFDHEAVIEKALSYES